MSGLPRLTLTAQLLLFVVTAVAAFGGTGMAIRQRNVVVVASGAPTDVASPTAAPQLVLPPIATTPAAEPTAPPTEPPQTPITIAFGGDVHGEPPIAQVLADGLNPFAGVQASLERADITVINLETAIGTAGSPADKTYTFQADAALADRAVDAGIDIVNLANNHGLDYGVAGADQTKEIVEAAGLATIGYGQNRDEAYAPHVVEAGGQTVAFLGLSRVLPSFAWEATDDGPGMASAYDVGDAAEAVRAAAEVADHVVVTIHWGNERATCANGTQVELANAMVAAGADVIVGHHPHVLQGVVAIDSALVAYSLGNFVFYATNPVQRETGVLTVQLSPAGVDGYAWEPARISNGVPLATDANGDIPQVSDPAPAAGDEDEDAPGGTPAPAPGPAPSSPTQPAPTETQTEDDPDDEGTAAPTEPSGPPSPTSGATDQPSATPSPAGDGAPAPAPAPATDPAPDPAPGPATDSPPEGPFDPSASSASREGAVHSLRRATAPDSPLPPLRQADSDGSLCAPIL